LLRTFLGSLSIVALTGLPAIAEQHTSGDQQDSAEAQQSEGSGDLQGDGFQTVARAAVSDREGNQIGTVTLNETLSGTSLVVVALSDLPEGSHGIHLHETGDCSADDFTSAGGHIPGDAEHGVFAENGPHPGDLPNAVVDSSGDLNAEYFNPRLEIENMIMDDDGAAFIVHAGADDYMSQPAGDSGDRIACGVFEPA